MRFIPSLQKSVATVYLTLSGQVAAAAALTVFEQARGRRLAREISTLGGDPHAPGAQAVVGAVTLFAVLIMLVAVTTAAAVAAYLTWLVQARQHADPRVRTAPALAAWLVPGVNLVAPPLLMYRLWWASRPPADRHGRWVALLAAWWLSWLAALVLVPVRLSLDSVPGEASLTGLGLLELAAVAVSALLCAATVRQITRIQTAGTRYPRPAQEDPVTPWADPAAPQGVPQLLTRQVPAQQAPHIGR
ncbi:DUF4328 domain-containing protein [Streptosporangium sp. NBC_01756]|uniref:DUF4328 domain-containing protein n=1 Tax=Streptosporangium sp. NBC_01756 TaxID=2975950 RepID=UPI002DDBB7E1|nr:DUF4328 domain-containing protein [Streptosporangium sp. NBC_01756]WSC88228.1 DUF4328 domain-containing protein [Streptosporangium sp. NBC_01756]